MPLDGRTITAKVFDRLVEAIHADMGGSDHPARWQRPARLSWLQFHLRLRLPTAETPIDFENASINRCSPALAIRMTCQLARRRERALYSRFAE